MKVFRQFYHRDDCETHYKLGKVLGTGSFASVRKATSRADQSEWAVKCIRKASLAPEDAEALQSEVAILQQLEHPHIVKLKEVFDCPKTFYMVMDLMTGGELFDRIVAKEKYSEKEAAHVIHQLCDALAYCHDRRVVHRDLKPENLLYASPAEDADIKIADFGLAKLLNEEALNMKTACGTPGYVAPEILEGRPYDKSVDMWSLGVILYILLCGFPPFYEENNAALFAAIRTGAYDFPSPYWDDVSEEAKALIGNLLVVDPTRRLSAHEVLRHPWVTGAVASEAPLGHAQAQLKRFNARRKFRAGVLAAGVIRAMRTVGGGSAEAEDAAAAAPAAAAKRT